MNPAARIAGPALTIAPIDDGIVSVVARAERGDQEAWRRIVSMYSSRLFALAKSRLGSAELAEEITQSVFATVARALPKGGYAETGRFESWLFRIAMNKIRDEARRAKRQASPGDPGTLSGVALAEPERRSEVDPGASLLRRALGELSESDREVVELRHHGGLSFKEMSELLGEPLGTLLARHHRALRKLKTIMSGMGYGGSGDRAGAAEREGVNG